MKKRGMNLLLNNRFTTKIMYYVLKNMPLYSQDENWMKTSTGISGGARYRKRSRSRSRRGKKRTRRTKSRSRSRRGKKRTRSRSRGKKRYAVVRY